LLGASSACVGRDLVSYCYHVYISTGTEWSETESALTHMPHNLDSVRLAQPPQCRYMRVEAFVVLVLAFVVNLFVICVFADGFYGVLSPDEVGWVSDV
jgi:hypothetical protein